MRDTNHGVISELPVASELQYASISTGDAALAELNLLDPSVQRELEWALWSQFAGRSLDILIALSMILLLLPLMVVIAVAIMVVDPGPVLFSHRRVGRSGTQFSCYKFRSMYVGAEAILDKVLANSPELRLEWAKGQKLANDPRVTPLGHFLRITSLDELPQLFNVLVGQMSVVGPRPITRSELARYGRHASAYLAVRPGLTGLWQVTRTDETSYQRRVATDVLYVRNKSLALDCKILIATVPAVLTRRGAI